MAAADGSPQTNITLDPASKLGSYGEPAWSPTGKWIVFTGDNFTSNPGHCGAALTGIGYFRPDGTGGAPIGPANDFCDSDPAWGPGRRLRGLHSPGQRCSAPELYLQALDDETPAVRLMAGAQAATQPSS